MPTSFALMLVVIVVVALVARLVVSGLPLRRLAVPMSVADVIVFVIGGLGLVLHCGSMFFSHAVLALPGTHGLVDTINALGMASTILFAVPCLLVLYGMRRVLSPVLVLVAAAFIAVGITMYDGGPLNAHLIAILVAVAVLAVVTSGLLVPRRNPTPMGDA